MDRESYSTIERHMLSLMKDGAHDEEHVYRVLYAALDLATGLEVDMDVLIAACLLHDIGREAQFKDPSMDHAEVGAAMAHEFLLGLGWAADKAGRARDCIRTHRYRTGREPQSIEAEILFDADKLDVTGCIGIARTLAYKGIVAEPLYSVGEDGRVLSGEGEAEPSFFQEYNWKLKKVYGRFYTEKAARIAEGRRKASVDFYESMLAEACEAHATGARLLGAILD